ncbi:ergothioneine biosynthesis glutamate--cysteine ligase EgtA [Geodermatophilus sp. DSM 44513]|uniref:ergothioneine biosynthesis glutamate--cysteine ligase EgtA n=1 Tax=Geodermatophilus sp. DSM 44513 TaxID=1528104 RepID=UPI0028F6FA1C|nr:ergothioneine biosynthesis glutamate--cysteine ligase EgtA [Geodermatophilus sp. DSM 44513]WNV75856.1 ergothioneine biosynthesis glutamate--cysteine ligase EgtA [Geodermatophilus sp. DSM 44513]
MAPITEEHTAVLDLDAAVAHVTAAALRDGPLGTVGLELEAHLVDLDAPATRVPWARVSTLVEALPALPGGSRVTLEPGGQVELSAPPYPDAGAAVAALRADRSVLAAALAAERLALAPVGADPLRPPARVCPAARYAAMEAHFAAVGCARAGTAMMAGTAALQVNLDAGPRAGWGERVALAHRLGPTLVAVAACSPLAGGRPTGWVSQRQRVWSDLDQARCGPLLGGADPAGEWAGYALSAPVMLVRHGAGAVPVRTRVRFADWLSGAVPLGGRRPTTADLDYHLTTLFPPVRPRGYLEVRYLDAAPEPWWPALAAVTAALLDDPVAAGHAAEATAPVAGAWDRAARAGLADPALHTAARACLAAAADAVPAALRPEVAALVDLVDRGRCPGDDLLDTARAGDATAALLSATGDPR